MTRLSVVVAVTSSLAVLAAGPRKPAATIGSSKEDEPCPVGPASGDVSYLRGMAFAFEPAPQEVRAQAIEDLGFLGDTRALNALAVLCLDPNPLLSRAAIRAVGSMRHPRAEEILGNLMRHPSVPAANRLFAVNLLPFQNTPSALRSVHFAARQMGVTPDVAQAARVLASELRNPTAEEVLPPLKEEQTAPPGTMAPAPFPSSTAAGDSK